MPRGRKRSTNGNGKVNKMNLVRVYLGTAPDARAAEIVEAMKQQHGLDLSQKMAGTYRYLIRKEGRRRARKARIDAKVTTAMTTGKTGDVSGLDDLLSAANKLGWRRIQRVVELALQGNS